MPIRHPIYSRAYLERARGLLDSFDKGEVPALFYAALEPRFGIEARLFEYLDPAIEGRPDGQAIDKEHAATKLLRKLAAISPNAAQAVTLRVGREGSTPSSSFEYTPVTSSLATMHGKLGRLLHHTFFRQNRWWFVERGAAPPEGENLHTVRSFLGSVCDELAEATRGTLLNHPDFRRFVDETLSESES